MGVCLQASEEGAGGSGLSNDPSEELPVPVLFLKRGALPYPAQQGEDPALLFDLPLPSFSFTSLAVLYLVI